MPRQYNRRCLRLSESEIEKKLSAGEKFAIRLRIPNGDTTFNDIVSGELKRSNTEIEDFVIARSDGSATYNLAVVVDDHDMGISHVVRGNDHITNTFKQIHIYRALGYDLPVFGHLPMILRPDRKKGAARRLRRTGRIPAVLYGGDRDPVALAIDPVALVKTMDPELRRNTLFKLEVEDSPEVSCLAMVKDYQSDIMTRLEGGRLQSKNIFVLSTFTTGDYVIPPIPVLFNLPDGSRKALLSEGVPIKVLSMLGGVGDSVDIKPLKPQYEFVRDWRQYILPAVAGFVALLVILLLFGAKRIPELARGLGRGIKEFKDGLKQVNDEVKELDKGEPEEEKKTKPSTKKKS